MVVTRDGHALVTYIPPRSSGVAHTSNFKWENQGLETWSFPGALACQGGREPGSGTIQADATSAPTGSLGLLHLANKAIDLRFGNTILTALCFCSPFLSLSKVGLHVWGGMRSADTTPRAQCGICTHGRDVLQHTRGAPILYLIRAYIAHRSARYFHFSLCSIFVAFRRPHFTFLYYSTFSFTKITDH